MKTMQPLSDERLSEMICNRRVNGYVLANQADECLDELVRLRDERRDAALAACEEAKRLKQRLESALRLDQITMEGCAKQDEYMIQQATQIAFLRTAIAQDRSEDEMYAAAVNVCNVVRPNRRLSTTVHIALRAFDAACARVDEQAIEREQDGQHSGG